MRFQRTVSEIVEVEVHEQKVETEGIDYRGKGEEQLDHVLVEKE